jgi:ABC-2 type transport system permease protein
MAVYKRTYRRYQGQLTAQWARFLVLTRYSLSTLFDSRPFTAFVVLSAIPLLASGVLIYLSHSPMARTLLQMSGPIIEIDPRFFRQVLQNQGMLALLIAAWAGPGLVAPDLANQALPLYLSRPFSRTEYVLGKMAVLFLLLSAITWIPALLLFGLQAGLEKGWLQQNYWMMGSISLAGILWIAVLSLLSLAISAWVRWRIVASTFVFGIFFVGAAFANMVNGILRTSQGHLVNVPHLIFGVIWPRLFRVAMDPEGINPHARHPHLPPGVVRVLAPPPVQLWQAWLVVVVVCAVCVLLLNRRLRAREVVRG